MKKAVPVFGLVLLCCVVFGLLCNFNFIFGESVPVRNTMRAASSSTSLASRGGDGQRPVQVLDTKDDAVLLARAEEALDAMADENFEALSQIVHPINGVTFTPYSTVEPESDLCFLPAQIMSAKDDKTLYLWGFTDGKGDHISLTIRDYFKRYVYNADYRNAPERAVDQVITQSNALENVADVFQDCRFVEYHFPGVDPEKKQFDWCSLKLVFAPYEEQWYLVGLIHSEWTI